MYQNYTDNNNCSVAIMCFIIRWTWSYYNIFLGTAVCAMHLTLSAVCSTTVLVH